MFFNKIPTAWGLINNLLSKLFGYTNLPYCKRTWLGFLGQIDEILQNILENLL